MAGRDSVNYRQHSLRPGVLPSTSINFLCGHESFRQLPSAFCAAGTTSLNLRQLLCRLKIFHQILSPLIFVNFQCGPKINRQIFMSPKNLLEASVRFSCHQETFRHLLSSFHVSNRPSVNILCCQVTFRQLLSTFCAAERNSVNFSQLSVLPEDIGSTFCAAGRPSVSFCQHFVQSGDLL